MIVAFGYLECRRRLETLRRFQDLVRHQERWAAEVGFARPIEQLLPEGTTELERPLVIEREIRRLQIVIGAYLGQVGVPTAIVRKEPRYDPEKGRTVDEEIAHYDLVRDYFAQPNDPFHRLGQQWFEALIGAIEQGIGVYQLRADRAVREKINPLVWLAGLLRAPVFVLNRAGLLRSAADRSKWIGVYAWAVRLVILLLLLLLAAKVGVSIPWQQLAVLLR